MTPPKPQVSYGLTPKQTEAGENVTFPKPPGKPGTGEILAAIARARG
jgi:hypothetical protein